MFCKKEEGVVALIVRGKSYYVGLITRVEVSNP